MSRRGGEGVNGSVSRDGGTRHRAIERARGGDRRGPSGGDVVGVQRAMGRVSTRATPRGMGCRGGPNGGFRALDRAAVGWDNLRFGIR